MKALIGVVVTLLLGFCVMPLCKAQPDLPRAQPDFYRLRVQIGDSFTQEIQVKAHDKFNVSTTLESSRWTIKGSNEIVPGNNNMIIRLDVQQEQKTPEGLFAVVHKAEPEVGTVIDGPEATMVTSVSTPPRGEIKTFKLAVGVGRTPVKEK